MDIQSAESRGQEHKSYLGIALHMKVFLHLDTCFGSLLELLQSLELRDRKDINS